jgi:hypothetical protein
MPTAGPSRLLGQRTGSTQECMHVQLDSQDNPAEQLEQNKEALPEAAGFSFS